MNREEDLQKAIDAVGGANRLFILTGAGVSAESGVPTFRGGGATWKGMPFEQLSSKRMIEQDLPLVWEWFDYRRNVVSGCAPNAGHNAIANAQAKGRFKEFSLATQNVDGLHSLAGSSELLELHGNLHQARCLSCGNLQDLAKINGDERPPLCPECLDSMRPNVVLFGEALNEITLLEAYNEAAECDVCLVVGTSAVVYPANMIPTIAKREGARVIEINPEVTELTALAHISIRGTAVEVLPILLA